MVSIWLSVEFPKLTSHLFHYVGDVLIMAEAPVFISIVQYFDLNNKSCSCFYNKKKRNNANKVKRNIQSPWGRYKN